MARYSLGPVDLADARAVFLDGRTVASLAYEPGERMEWSLYASAKAFAAHDELPAPFTRFWTEFPSLDAAKAFLGIETDSAAPALRDAA